MSGMFLTAPSFCTLLLALQLVVSILINYCIYLLKLLFNNYFIIIFSPPVLGFTILGPVGYRIFILNQVQFDKKCLFVQSLFKDFSIISIALYTYIILSEKEDN